MQFEITKTTVNAPSRLLDYKWDARGLNFREEDMKYKDSWVMRSYVRAWRMWNTWLVANERPETEIEDFIEQGFVLVDSTPFKSLLVGDVGYVIGQDNGYDVEITQDSIHISFKGKPRYSWFPCVVQMGNLKHEEDQSCRFCIGPGVEPTKSD